MSICKIIENKLNQELSPKHLEVINESYLHNVEPGSESHIRIVAVSKSFKDLNLVKRHQMIYQHIKNELSGPIHAISLHTFSPEEWIERNEKAQSSPECLGGKKNEGNEQS